MGKQEQWPVRMGWFGGVRPLGASEEGQGQVTARVGVMGAGFFLFPVEASSKVSFSVYLLGVWSPRNEGIEGVGKLGGSPQLSLGFRLLRPCESIIGLGNSWEWPGHLEEGVGSPGAPEDPRIPYAIWWWLRG